MGGIYRGRRRERPRVRVCALTGSLPFARFAFGAVVVARSGLGTWLACWSKEGEEGEVRLRKSDETETERERGSRGFLLPSLFLLLEKDTGNRRGDGEMGRELEVACKVRRFDFYHFGRWVCGPWTVR